LQLTAYGYSLVQVCPDAAQEPSSGSVTTQGTMMYVLLLGT